jgi:hypothetical protein
MLCIAALEWGQTAAGAMGDLPRETWKGRAAAPVLLGETAAALYHGAMSSLLSPRARPLVLVCLARRVGASPSCGKRGSAEVLTTLRAAVAAAGLDVDVEESPCLGYCSVGINLRIVGDAFFHGMTPQTLQPVLDRLHALTSHRRAPDLTRDTFRR